MKLKKIFAVLAASAVAASMAISASAADKSTCKISADTAFTVADLPEYEGYAQTWLQNWPGDPAVAYEVAMVTITVDGKEYDVSSLMVEGDANNTVFLTGEEKKELADPGIDIQKITNVNYYVVFEADYTAEEPAWSGGAIGTNSTTDGWKQFKDYGSDYKEDGTAARGIMLQDCVIEAVPSDVPSYTALKGDADENKPAEDNKPAGDGDTKPGEDNNKPTGLVGLSLAGLAVAGAAVVASKKKN